MVCNFLYGIQGIALLTYASYLVTREPAQVGNFFNVMGAINTSWIKRLSLFGVNWKSDISIIHIRNNDYIQEDHKNQIDLIFQLFVYILQQFKLNLTKIQVL